jgi:cell wall-associated NlpC family hydrolase
MNDVLSRRRLGAAALVALLTTVASAACASRTAVPRPFPGAATPPNTRGTTTSATRPPSAIASDVIATALALKGTQYRDGGSEPTRGFDCSGLVQWVFAQHGTALPRETREQYAIGRRIDRDDVRPGDLVFFETVGKGPSHVGIALGSGEFVHAPSTRGVVRVESYEKSDYWARRWIGGRRIAPTNGP